jgi:hypothetical protein
VIIRRSVALAALLSVSALANAAPFTAGNVVVERVGTGAAALSNASTSVFLNEYTTTGALVQSVALPTAAAGGANALTTSGSATSEGLISRSTDGASILVPGYAVAPGTASVATSTAAVAPRELGVVSVDNTVRTFTAGSLLGGNNVRSVASVHDTSFYLGGAAGIAYVNGTAGTATSLTTTNTRALNITNDQLFFSSGSGTTGIYAVNGLPSTAASFSANLVAASASPYAFLFADLNAAIGGVDTLYVADDSTTANGGGIRKFSKQANGSWTFNSVLATATAVRGLTGMVANGEVQLFATSATQLYGVTDTGGYNASLTGSPITLATAGTNTAFRGVTLAPAVPEPETYGLALVGLALVGGLRLRRR